MTLLAKLFSDQARSGSGWFAPTTPMQHYIAQPLGIVNIIGAGALRRR
jgi:hypothetical protein